MDEGHFIKRDAQIVAREMREGDAASAANLLREDCAHMNPREFSRLIQETSRNTGNCTLADLQIERDGDVVVRSQDGRRYNAGSLPREEAARFLPPPPPVVIIERPDVHRRPPVVVIERPDVHHRPPVVIMPRQPEYCPPVVVMPRPDVHRQPPVVIIDHDRDFRPDPSRFPGRPQAGRSDGPSDTVIGAVGGAIIGGVIGDGKGKNGALKGAVIGGTAGAILGHVSDEMKEKR
ncbi:MAG: glycine zipper 2TM domain-containing protein [Candidatus Obscuribacterales bacterium]